MRDTIRADRSSIYSPTGMNRNKGNIARLPIILCATVGIFLGSIAFNASKENVGIKNDFITTKNLITEAYNKKLTGSDLSEVIKDLLFRLLGMDRYNPITIITANNPYFRMLYNNQYQDFVEQQERQEMARQFMTSDELREQQIQKHKESVSAAESKGQIASGSTFKEVSSSITFEGDVEETEKNNNPVVSSGQIKVINQTKYSININKLLNEPLKLPMSKTGPQILVYHTHTTESYLKSLDELNKNVASRTRNMNYSVVSVGDALINNLKKYNINVLHNSTIHDIDYNTSYLNSLKTLTKYTKKYDTLKMTIDLHRDAIGDGKLRVVKNINGKNVAQIMFVIGTDAKLSNPKWRENLKLAIKIQARLNELYPGLAKPIYISQNRYNQHLTNGSVIIEIGGDGNVIDECKRSTYYLAQAINDVIYNNK